MTWEMSMLFNKWEATITWPASMLSGGKEHKQTCPLPVRAPQRACSYKLTTITSVNFGKWSDFGIMFQEIAICRYTANNFSPLNRSCTSHSNVAPASFSCVWT